MENTIIEENNKGINKKIFIKVLIGIIILLILGIFGFNLFMNRIISEADKSLNMDEFDKAIHYYQIALKYNIGKDQDIKSKIQLCNDLKGSLFAYNAGLDLLNEKDYVEAIRTFGYVNSQDEKRYNLAQAKIAESEELYLESKIERAKYYREHDNYDQAIKILKLILDDDPNNETAKSLIAQYEAEKAVYLKAKAAKDEAKWDAIRRARSVARWEAELQKMEADYRAKLKAEGLSDAMVEQYVKKYDGYQREYFYPKFK